MQHPNGSASPRILQMYAIGSSHSSSVGRNTGAWDTRDPSSVNSAIPPGMRGMGQRPALGRAQFKRADVASQSPCRGVQA